MGFQDKGIETVYGKQIPTYFRQLNGLLNGAGDDPVFRFRVNTANAGTSLSNQFSLPLVSTGNYNFVVNWGDGNEDTITVWNQSETTHTYASADTYDVTITGEPADCFGWSFANGGDCLKLIQVSNWGNLRPTQDGFWGCSNCSFTATDILDLSASTSCRNLFRDCTSFNAPVNDWPVQNVEIMTGMFRNTAFNQPCNSWDTTACTITSGMFQDTPFNQPLDNWDMSNCSNMSSMFQSSDFNQDIGNWNVAKCQTMASMFASSAFNQDISGWTTTVLNNMVGTFANTPFNQPLNNWNVSSVTSFAACFQNTPFNQDLNSWNVSACRNFTAMFQGSSFNGNITSWTLDTTVGANIQFFNMFRDCPFNQNIGGWNTSEVTAMNFMFFNNSAFNQAGISAWNTGKCTTFASMFRQCPTADPDVSGWDITALTDATFMFQLGGQSQANYDALLIGWEAQAYNTGVFFDTNAQYTSGGAADTARSNLITLGSWDIDDGGPA